MEYARYGAEEICMHRSDITSREEPGRRLSETELLCARNPSNCKTVERTNTVSEQAARDQPQLSSHKTSKKSHKTSLIWHGIKLLKRRSYLFQTCVKKLVVNHCKGINEVKSME